MSIKSLQKNIIPPRLGKIHLGIKGDSKYPKSVNYFVVPDEIKKVYGEKPTQLDVLFFSDSPEINAPYFYKRYGRGLLLCKSDGENSLVYKGKDGKGQPIYEKSVCNINECEYYKKKECKMVMNLRIIIPTVNGTGFYQIDTSSYNSLKNIHGSLQSILSIHKTLIGVPFKLNVREEKSAKGKFPVMFLSVKESAVEYVETNDNKYVSIDPIDDELPDDLYPQDVKEDDESKVTVKKLAVYWDGLVDSVKSGVGKKLKEEMIVKLINGKNISVNEINGIRDDNMNDDVASKTMAIIRGHESIVRDWVKNYK